jgi:hypothetical protein
MKKAAMHLAWRLKGGMKQSKTPGEYVEIPAKKEP